MRPRPGPWGSPGAAVPGREAGGRAGGGGSDKGPGAGRRGQSGAASASAAAMGMLSLPGFLSCGKKKVRRPRGVAGRGHPGR